MLLRGRCIRNDKHRFPNKLRPDAKLQSKARQRWHYQGVGVFQGPIACPDQYALESPAGTMKLEHEGDLLGHFGSKNIEYWSRDVARHEDIRIHSTKYPPPNPKQLENGQDFSSRRKSNSPCAKVDAENDGPMRQSLYLAQSGFPVSDYYYLGAMLSEQWRDISQRRYVFHASRRKEQYLFLHGQSPLALTIVSTPV